MSDEKLERVFQTVDDPGKRATLKKLVLGAAFAVPIIASFSVKDLAYAGTGSLGTTVTSSGTPVTLG